MKKILLIIVLSFIVYLSVKNPDSPDKTEVQSEIIYMTRSDTNDIVEIEL